MNFSTTLSESIGDDNDVVFSNVTNATEDLIGNILDDFVTTHINVTNDIAQKLGNITEEAATGLTAQRLGNITEEAVAGLIKVVNDTGICDFIVRNVTSGNVTTTVGIYNPAACGVYGSNPALKPLLIFILVCFTLWAVFGNGCLVGVIITDTNMQEPGNIFLCAMAFTDIAQSFMHTPLAIQSLVHGESHGGNWCRTQSFFVPFLAALSMYLQTSLWICRYIHIAYPFRYQTMMTCGRLALAMALCFLVALAPPLVGLARVGKVLTWSVNMFSVDIAEPLSILIPCGPGGPEGTFSTILCLVGMIISCCFAGLIYREARKSQKKHNQQQAWQAQADKLENKIKAAKTLAIVVGVQWITWIPAIVGALLRRSGVVTIATATFYGDITYVIWQTSTFSDSIVYAFRNKIYRRALAKIYRKMRNAINELEFP